MYASSRKRVTESITTVPHILEVLEGLRSVHTRRQVAATCRGDALQRQIASCVLESFVKIFVAAAEFCRRKFFLRLVAAKNFCCGDKDFHKNSPPHTKRFVAATRRSDMLLQLVARPVHME